MASPDLIGSWRRGQSIVGNGDAAGDDVVAANRELNSMLLSAEQLEMTRRANRLGAIKEERYNVDSEVAAFGGLAQEMVRYEGTGDWKTEKSLRNRFFELTGESELAATGSFSDMAQTLTSRATSAGIDGGSHSANIQQAQIDRANAENKQTHLGATSAAYGKQHAVNSLADLSNAALSAPLGGGTVTLPGSTAGGAADTAARSQTEKNKDLTNSTPGTAPPPPAAAEETNPLAAGVPQQPQAPTPETDDYGMVAGAKQTDEFRRVWDGLKKGLGEEAGAQRFEAQYGFHPSQIPEVTRPEAKLVANAGQQKMIDQYAPSNLTELQEQQKPKPDAARANGGLEVESPEAKAYLQSAAEKLDDKLPPEADEALANNKDLVSGAQRITKIGLAVKQNAISSKQAVGALGQAINEINSIATNHNEKLASDGMLRYAGSLIAMAAYEGGDSSLAGVEKAFKPIITDKDAYAKVLEGMNSVENTAEAGFKLAAQERGDLHANYREQSKNTGTSTKAYEKERDDAVKTLMGDVKDKLSFMKRTGEGADTNGNGSLASFYPAMRPVIIRTVNKIYDKGKGLPRGARQELAALAAEGINDITAQLGEKAYSMGKKNGAIYNINSGDLTRQLDGDMQLPVIMVDRLQDELITRAKRDGGGSIRRDAALLQQAIDHQLSINPDYDVEADAEKILNIAFGGS